VKFACTRLTRRQDVFTACIQKREHPAFTEKRTDCWNDFALPACTFFTYPVGWGVC